MAIVGTTVSLVLSAAGLILFVVTTVIWIRDTRRDIDELPEDHHTEPARDLDPGPALSRG